MGLLVVVTALAAYLWQRPRPVLPNSVPTEPFTAIAEVLPRIQRGALNNLPAKLDEPLHREFELVVNDTRTALRSVAMTFLPESAWDQR